MTVPPHSRYLLAAFVVVLLVAATLRWADWWPHPSNGPAVDAQVLTIARQVAAIEAKEKQLATTVWAKELLAEHCGQVIEQLWDRLNGTGDKFGVLASIPFGEIIGPKWGAAKTLAHGIELSEQAGPNPAWTPGTWTRFVTNQAKAGWEIAQVELRHVQFDTDPQGRPDRSRFYLSAHLTNPKLAERAILEGDLIVFWQKPTGPDKLPGLQRIETQHLSLRRRHGEPAFRETLSERVPPPEGSYFIDPLILYDLDGDGLSEIILAAKNLILHRGPDGHFESKPLCRYPPGLIFTGLIADFDGDGAADFLCAKFDGLFLFKGSAQGTFDEPGRLVWAANPHLKYGQVLTCGDIDGDGDLDVWLGQYKVPYDRGQMPTPYYDANDGYPSYLLLNDGQGNFTDATVSAGLGSKRWRRAYSGSFVDFNDDQHPDLVVASDFAGLELYANDGHGHFTDVTSQNLPERHGFGMSQLCADFNGDGRLDLLMIGMNVPVADRLRHFGQARPGFESYLSMSGPMTYGNRLFLKQPAGPFLQTGLNDSMARTGWSWSASAFDFDNDGYADLYITNGHETKQSVRDYDTEFWLHDIYVGNSRDDLAGFAYFQSKLARTRGRGMSYGGNEKNRLFLNQAGQSFIEIGHLMGVGLGADSRNVVADDLDGDGRVDLLVTTFEVWPQTQQTLRVFQNTLEKPGNWIGFRLREQGRGISPVGARITLQSGGRTAVHEIVTGEGYRSQSANTVHFGLGSAQQVDQAEIRWSNGRSVVLRQPPINQYHAVRLP